MYRLQFYLNSLRRALSYVILHLLFVPLNVQASTNNVSVSADRLVINISKQQAEFLGHVVAHHLSAELLGEKMIVYHSQTNKITSASNQMLDGLQKIEIKGNVQAITKERRATADYGVYNANDQQLCLSGNVRVTQDKSVITGSQLLYNLLTQHAIMNTEPQINKRVQATLHKSRNQEE